MTQPRARQDPVSCVSCRKKKLKCDREQPCFNCTTRRVSCDYGPGIKSVGASLSRTVAVPKTDQLRDLQLENNEIKARLERLEQLFISSSNKPGLQDSSPATADGSSTGRGDEGLSFEAPSTGQVGDHRPTKIRRIARADAPATVFPSPSTSIANTPDADAAKDYKGDYQWLEGVGTQENTRLSQLSLPIAIRITTLEEIKKYVMSQDQDSRIILLPTYDETQLLLQQYIEQLDPTQHIIHCPTVQRDVEALYRRLEESQSVEPGETVLLLAILTSLGSYWGVGQSDNHFVTPASAAAKMALLWLRTTMDVLEHARRTASATIQAVQANIILFFLVFHIEGFSPKVRAMHFAALAMAKDMRLHRTDDPSLPINAADVRGLNKVEKEMRRRVWWHVASSDWSLAVCGGPHEGTYSVNPKHMRVKRPRNVSDEDLEVLPEDFELPLSEPTIMAYYLQRIRMAEISRDMADLSWAWEAEDITVDDIRRLDAKFDKYFAELPNCLQLNDVSRQGHAGAGLPDFHISLQSYIVNLIGNAKRCKFHMPFLLRASTDSTYAFSRDACLRAARVLISIREDLMTASKELWVSSTRLCGLMHISFYGTVVLVMDMICNRNAESEAARKEEIQRACQSLEAAKEQSLAAGMFLDSLLAILRKHRIKLQNQDQAGRSDADGFAVTTGDTAFAVAYGSVCTHNVSSVPAEGPKDFENLEFDQLWQSYVDLDPTINPQNWDALMNDIETWQPNHDMLEYPDF